MATSATTFTTPRERVSRDQRHTRRDPCPICSGGDDDPRHRGIRCTMGFTSSDGRYAHCGRPEYGGRPDPNGITYAHRLDGPCPWCAGRAHGDGAPILLRQTTPEKPPRTFQGRRYLPETTGQGEQVYRFAADYEYRDLRGALVYLERRYELPDSLPDGMTKRPKTFRQYTHRDGDVWVNRLEVAPLLFNLPVVAAAPPDAPIYVCEGGKAATAAQQALQAAGVPGVVTTTSGSVGGAARVDMTPLAGRRVVILPDADPRDPDAPDLETKAETYAATFAQRARQAGAAQTVTLTLEGLPAYGDIVEWLAVPGHDGAELARLAGEVLDTAAAAGMSHTSQETDVAEYPDALEYRTTQAGLRRVKRERDAAGVERETLIPLTNYLARIIADVRRDDGAETTLVYEIEAQLCGAAIGGVQRRPVRFMIPADRYNSMGWAEEHLGAAAYVYPGQSAREHARVAIKALSARSPEGIAERCEYTHTGWRQIADSADSVGEQWLYLHTGGAIGATGARTDVTVALEGALSRYTLPDPTTTERAQAGALAVAIRASLGLLDIAPDEITIPLYAAIWRAASGGADFALHLTGATGGGKSELAALIQQHYGADMNARRLPASWSSTANALEAQAFSAKDAILVVDDFVAAGNQSDAARLHREADRLLRGLGNAAGRARMQADTSLRLPKIPRGLILSTGEDTPRGQSLRARMLILELSPGALDWPKMTACQDNAEAGTYVLALAGYIQWMASHYDEVRAALRPAAIRAAMWPGASGALQRHRRTSDATAQLGAALRLFTRYAVDVQALTDAAARALLERAQRALERVAAQQADEQAQGDPVRRFLALLASAIASGAAHVAARDGGPPLEVTERWGWRLRQVGQDGSEWQPQGRSVAWLDGTSLYLDPNAAFAAAQALAAASNDPLAITPGTLWKRLRDRGLLLSQMTSAQTLKARKECGGVRRWVIHIPVSALEAETDPDPTPERPASLEAHARLSHAQNPANPATGVHDARMAGYTAVDRGQGGWVSGLDSRPQGWVTEGDPASADAESMGSGALVAGLAEFPTHQSASDTQTGQSRAEGMADFVSENQPAAQKPSPETQPSPCDHPPHARHRLQRGVLACGLCGVHLQNLQNVQDMSQQAARAASYPVVEHLAGGAW